MTLGEHPTYAPFFRMLRMGIPLGAVKQKAGLAGADVSLLDLDPGSPAPA